MNKRENQTRSKIDKLAKASQAIRLRRCAIKLRRYDSDAVQAQKLKTISNKLKTVIAIEKKNTKEYEAENAISSLVKSNKTDREKSTSPMKICISNLQKGNYKKLTQDTLATFESTENEKSKMNSTPNLRGEIITRRKTKNKTSENSRSKNTNTKQVNVENKTKVISSVDTTEPNSQNLGQTTATHSRLRKCVVRLHRVKPRAAQNKDDFPIVTSKRNYFRNPLLALTKRRDAKIRLQLKKHNETIVEDLTETETRVPISAERDTVDHNSLPKNIEEDSSVNLETNSNTGVIVNQQEDDNNKNSMLMCLESSSSSSTETNMPDIDNLPKNMEEECSLHSEISSYVGQKQNDEDDDFDKDLTLMCLDTTSSFSTETNMVDHNNVPKNIENNSSLHSENSSCCNGTAVQTLENGHTNGNATNLEIQNSLPRIIVTEDVMPENRAENDELPIRTATEFHVPQSLQIQHSLQIENHQFSQKSIDEQMAEGDNISEQNENINIIETDKQKKKSKNNTKKPITKTTAKTSRALKGARTSKTVLKPSTSNKTDVYEFLSQSQTSDSDKDVAADIIKKLIDQGKVAVAKNYKGRPRITHKKAIKRNHLKRLQRQQPTLKKRQVNFEQDADIEPHMEDFEQHEQPAFERSPIVPSPKKSNNEGTATFSNLARSVLVRETRNQENAQKRLADSERVLGIVQKYVSTPFKPQKITEDSIAVELSPIPHTSSESSKSITKPQLATALFHENLNDSFSFSSNNVRNNSQENISVRPTTRTISSLNAFEISTPPQNNSSLSSFSSNDSNAENQPPTVTATHITTSSRQNQIEKVTTTSSTITTIQNFDDENSIVHSGRSIPNPNRTLPHRSPLKAINILDIVVLPPYKGPMHDKVASINENSSKNEESLLFGFEEYLEESDDASDTQNKINDNRVSKQASKTKIRSKLKQLRKYYPKKSVLRNPASSTITKNIFDDVSENGNKNRNIKEMFCSTMINAGRLNEESNTTAITTTSVGDRTSKFLNSDSDDDFEETIRNNKISELFGDPETSFDHQSKHRTYERPFKRKRKLLNQYSVVLDSDHGTDDEDDHNNSVSDKVKKKKKKRQGHEESPEREKLDKFVSEFNSILKEAEDYELIVE